jgi:hypothetical protein
MTMHTNCSPDAEGSASDEAVAFGDPVGWQLRVVSRRIS